jgi:hypothetical protein
MIIQYSKYENLKAFCWKKTTQSVHVSIIKISRERSNKTIGCDQMNSWFRNISITGSPAAKYNN